MIKVSLSLVCLLLICIYSTFMIKYNAREKIREFHKIEQMISEEEQNIRLLQVDLEHISSPSKIQKMLYMTPNLKPIMQNQVIVIEEK